MPTRKTNIEVERKFLVPDLSELRERLSELQATPKDDRQIHDVYFDTPELALSKQNRWLRKRNGQWEYKIPVVLENCEGKNLATSIFQELEGLEAVKQELEEQDGLTLDEECLCVNQIASFVTTRCSWICKGFTIDVDSMDFGYRIGEIELMVTQEEACGAIEKIERFAAELGLRVDREGTPTTGKLETYLFRFDRKSFDTLEEAGIIPPDPAQKNAKTN